MCQRDIPHGPYIADVKFAAMQSSAILNAFDNHTSQRADLAVGISLHHLPQQFQTTVTIAVVESAHAVDEEELGTVGTLWETFRRE